jgi:hypothetical protein
MKDITTKDDIQEWFSKRTWSVSGNRAAAATDAAAGGEEEAAIVGTSQAGRVVFPKSTQDVAGILSALPPSQPVAVVCGGHSSSNASTVACPGAVIIDLQQMNSVTNIDKEKMEVTVEGGATFRPLAEAVAEAGGALPIGTGDTVGVAGYLVNGGISGYFGRRLGMLGQRIAELTFVTADGTIRTIGPSSSGQDETLFNAVLGAGSALGIVTSITLRMESDSAFFTGGQLIVPCGTKDAVKCFARRALSFLRDSVLPDPSVSMELVVTADYTCISTFIFYDKFEGDPVTYVGPIRDAASAGKVPIVVDDVSQWNTWLEAASCLWPIIQEMKGSPLVRIDHCMGTMDSPGDDILDFIANEWIGGVPLNQAFQSIVEIRTLGGLALDGDTLPSGNCKCQVFADMIIAYDGSDKSLDDRRSITQSVDAVVTLARKQKSVQVDFSATHSQSDDTVDTSTWCTARERRLQMFGSEEMYEAVRAAKHKYDPSNRFRCHPFVLSLQ